MPCERNKAPPPIPPPPPALPRFATDLGTRDQPLLLSDTSRIKTHKLVIALTNVIVFVITITKAYQVRLAKCVPFLRAFFLV